MLWVAAILPVVTIGAWLVWRGLFGDRAKGRARCPGCWYSMSGINASQGAWRCPECGLETRHERDLFRSRRRWSSALTGLVLLSVATSWPVYRLVRATWWRAYLPDTVLIAMVGRAADDWPERLLIERVRRDDVVVGEPVPGALWAWQRGALVSRCISIANDPLHVPHRRRTAAWIGGVLSTDFAERERLALAEPVLFSNDLDPAPCPAPDEILAAARVSDSTVRELLAEVAPNVLGDVTGDTPRAVAAEQIDLDFDDHEGRDCLIVLKSWPLRQAFLLLSRRGVSWGLCGVEHASRSDDSGRPAHLIHFGRRPFLAVETATPGSGLGYRGENLTLYSLSTAGIQPAARVRVRAELDAEFPISYAASAGITRLFEHGGRPAFEVRTRIEYLNSPALWKNIVAAGVEAARTPRRLFTREWTQRLVWSDAASRFVLDAWWEPGGPERPDAAPEFGIYKSTYDNFVRINRDRLLAFARSGEPGAAEWARLLPLVWPDSPAAAELAAEAGR